MQRRLRAHNGAVRRAAPYLLVGLLVLGVAGAAALGVAQEGSVPVPMPAHWVAGVLATTEQAGTAHFSYTHLTRSPDPDLRAVLFGSGVVDFSTGAASVVEVDHDVTFTASGHQPLHPVPSVTTVDAIVVGGVLYQRIVVPGLLRASRFVKLPFPVLPRSQRGLELALNASVALDALRGPEPVAALHDLGPAVLDGIATTRYRVDYAPLTSCAPAHGTPATLTQPPSTVWVDGRGRLVQVRSTLRFAGRLPHGAGTPSALGGFTAAPTTTTATLTFSAFGEPVHIAAPPSGALVPQANSSTGTASSSFRVRPCHASG